MSAVPERPPSALDRLPWSGVRVLHHHVEGASGDDRPDYHEWVTLGGRVKADVLGRPNSRIINARWALWQCNNRDCPGQAIVMDDAITTLIEAVASANSPTSENAGE